MKLDDRLKIVLVLFVCCAVVPAFGQSQVYVTGNDLTVTVFPLHETAPVRVAAVLIPPMDQPSAQTMISTANGNRSGLQRLTAQDRSGLQLLAQRPGNRQPMADGLDHGQDVDVSNLEEGIPSCVEDAYVLPDDHFETQAIVNWAEADWGHWREYQFQISAGLSSNWQGTLGRIERDNDLDGTGDGDTFLKFMHQCHLSDKDAGLFGVELNFPGGQDYARLDGSYPPFNFVVNERKDRIDVTLMGVYSRILNDEKTERLHLQVKHTFVNSAPVGFADSQWSVGVGFDKLIRDDTLAIAAVCWSEGSSPCNPDASVLQLGLRHKESRRFLWGTGVKIGLDWPAANWGLVFGAQYGL